ncbi:MAG: hypothetical protein ACM3SY_20865 [Candidatus Omnitrophota bacterium]
MLPTNKLSYIYNPLNQTEEEALKNFVVRQKEFNYIFNDIKSSDMAHPEPHYIIQGQRGQGKTTLLLKLYYEIRRDNQLNTFLVPIIFKEEQYHINYLFDLWAHTAEVLEEENPEFNGLYEAIDEVYDSEDAEPAAFKLIEKELKEKKKKLILLVDNIGQLLDKLDEREHHRLREILISCAEIRIIGASAVVLEYTFDYSKPFYELFKIITLEGLTNSETVTLLLNLGESYGQENIKRIVANEPGRIEALRRLTNGVPRTIILLFEIFVDHENGGAFQDLEYVLDRVSPLYKHRMDDLSPQQQKIVDAIAMNWDAIGVKEIAERTRMESKAVSAQLKLLERNRIIHKIKTSTKNYYYQISERFFNIWYLMRYGKKHGKNRVQWLVNFLQNWCSQEELIDRTRKHIAALKKGKLTPKHALYFTEALAALPIPKKLQHEVINKAREFLTKTDKTLVKELSKSDIELIEEAIKLYNQGEFLKVLRKLEAVQNKYGNLFFVMGAIFHSEIKDYKKAEKYYLLAIQKGNVRAMNDLAYLYLSEKKNKTKALTLINESIKNSKDYLLTHTLALVLLWNNRIEEALKFGKEISENKEFLDKYPIYCEEYFLMLMAKRQYYAALKFFEENPFDLKERFKPVYYALMHFLEKDYPNEFIKMGSELKQTVEEIIEVIHQWEKDYA